MGCASGIVKYLLFLFNFIFVVGGLALLIVGIVKKLDLDVGLKIIKKIENLDVAPTMAIVVGALIFFIAFLGCCGAIKENTCMLTTYGVIVLLFLILQIAVAVLAFIAIKDNGGDFDESLTKEIDAAFQKYNHDTTIKENFDALQQTFQCCGVRGPSDWSPNPVPGSCCEDNPKSSCTSKPFSVGCGKEVSRLVKSALNALAYVAIGFAVAELIASIFAFCLSSSIKNENRRGHVY